LSRLGTWTRRDSKDDESERVLFERNEIVVEVERNRDVLDDSKQDVELHVRSPRQ